MAQTLMKCRLIKGCNLIANDSREQRRQQCSSKNYNYIMGDNSAPGYSGHKTHYSNNQTEIQETEIQNQLTEF